MSTTLTFSTVKQLGAVLLALGLVVAAGTVVGQAPELFGADVADDEPSASITFEDQRGDGTSVTIDEVTLSEGGYVAISDETGTIVGVSDYLEPGTHENVTVEQDAGDELRMLGRLTATAHRNTTDDETFAYREEGGEEDLPYVDDDGYPVTDVASVALIEANNDRNASTSFRVDSVERIDRATANETVEIEATIENPNDFETRQHVDLRLDGEVVERRIVTLGPEEKRDITLELDLRDVEPGSHVYGVYTGDDGELVEFAVDLDAEATVSIREVTASNATVDATLPAGGFVAFETDNGTIVGTSDTLDPGAYENVTVSLEDDLETNESVTAVLYRGDAETPDEAEPYGENDERVSDSATLEAAAEGDETDAEGEREREEADGESAAGSEDG